jgi:hypothetical protein
MRNLKLLDRQVELLQYLTNPELIFGGDKIAELARDPSLRGFSIPHLRLEAEMSFEKRLGKIRDVLEQTFAHLGTQRDALARSFVTACPPKTFRRYDEALCFYEFLKDHWRSQPANPPYVPDIAKLEISIAKVKSMQGAGVTGSPRDTAVTRRPAVRLSPAAVLLNMEYDLRSIFQSRGNSAAPARRGNHVLVAQLKVGRGPRVVNLSNAVARLLGSLDQWTPLEQILTGLAPDQREVRQTLHWFLGLGVVELLQ